VKIDLHIHSREGSDGRWNLEDIFAEAARRGIDVISITDHDSIDAQISAAGLAEQYGMRYIYGVELNVTMSPPRYKEGKAVSLDFLGYGFDVKDEALVDKLRELRQFRQVRAGRILSNINAELKKEEFPEFSQADLEAIEATVDGVFGRPHIADYMVTRGLVRNRQGAFDKYLVKCDVPKMPLSLEEASGLVRGAGGKLVLAHPSDPNGTSLVALSSDLNEQQRIVVDLMLGDIDGIECWHTRHTPEVTEAYARFAKDHGLMVTGGSDCHQQPLLMGEVEVPGCVAEQFLEQPFLQCDDISRNGSSR